MTSIPGTLQQVVVASALLFTALHSVAASPFAKAYLADVEFARSLYFQRCGA
jgi:hypothetical protein